MNNAKKLNDLTFSALEGELLSLRSEQFKLRMKQASGALDKTHHVRIVRRSIARVKTMMTEKAGEHHVSE